MDRNQPRSVKLAPAVDAAWRDLALALGYRLRRGGGLAAGRGDHSAVLRRLVAAYGAAPEATLALLAPLVVAGQAVPLPTRQAGDSWPHGPALTPTDAAALRRLARAFGCYGARGPAAVAGDMAGLLAHLAAAYRQAPTMALTALQGLLELGETDG